MPQPKDKDRRNGFKNKIPIYAVYKRPTSKQGTHSYWKWRAGKRYFTKNGDQKKAGVAILILDKIDFEIKAVKRDKEVTIMIKGSIPGEDITIVNIYAPNTGALQYVSQMLTSMKGEINSNTIVVGDFNTPFTCMDRSTKQKISKETQTLNDTMDQLDLIDIYRTFHPKAMNFTFFSSAHGNFSRIDHNMGHKSPVQFSSVTQSCLTLCDPMNHSTPGLCVHHQHPEST